MSSLVTVSRLFGLICFALTRIIALLLASELANEPVSTDAPVYRQEETNCERQQRYDMEISASQN